MNISKVDFGRLDAENEEHLFEYFVDTGVIPRLVDGSKQYIIGRKGSGKTALFRKLDDRAIKHATLPLDFSNYSWEAHKKLKEDGVPVESAYLASWRFTLLMTIVGYLAKSTTGSAKRESEKLIRSIYGEERPKWYRLLFDKVRRIRRLDLPGIEGVGKLGGVEFNEDTSGPLLASSIGVWSLKLYKFIKEYYNDYPVTITLDRLDDGWDASEASKQILIGVIKAAREINSALKLKGSASPVLVFLRSDIFNNIQFNDKNKIGMDIEYLDWTEDNLFDVALSRIARSLKCNKSEAWNRVFLNDRMRQRATVKSYLLKRTMLRPRDIVAFCIKCQEVAVGKEHDKVGKDDVYEAEDRYSLHIYNELDDEMHKQLPRARESLQILQDMQKQRFVLKDWTKSLRERIPLSSDIDALARLKELFEYSVVGVQRKGGRTGGTKFQFAYEDRFLQPNFNVLMVVHSSLKKALSLKDRGA